MKNILLLIVCLFSVENMYANKFFDDISKALKKKKVVISPMVKHIDYAHEAIPSKKINQNQLNKFFDKYGEYVRTNRLLEWQL